MKKALYLILVIIASLLLYARLRYHSPATDSATSTPSPSPLASIDSPLPRVNLTEKIDNDYFSLAYPSVASTSSSVSPDSRTWAITYMGEAQKKSGRTQTELWDGYALSVTRFEVVGEDPAQTQALADRQSTIDACGPENATELKSGKLGNYDTLTYFGGCLGEAEHHYLMLADTLYHVSIMVVGSDNDKSGYSLITDAIITTLEFK